MVGVVIVSLLIMYVAVVFIRAVRNSGGELEANRPLLVFEVGEDLYITPQSRIVPQGAPGTLALPSGEVSGYGCQNFSNHATIYPHGATFKSSIGGWLVCDAARGRYLSMDGSNSTIVRKAIATAVVARNSNAPHYPWDGTSYNWPALQQPLPTK
jgi:hypothetical protein